MFACIHIRHCPADTHRTLLECAQVFSPRVENTAIGTVVFDLEGLERLFGSFSDIAENVAAEARARHLQANVAVAANADAAICAARGFGGITIITRGTESKRLGELPLEVLIPSTEILETLVRWGIRTLGAFAKLPAVQITERLGQTGVELHRRACGAGIRPIVAHVEAERFVEILDLDYEILTIEPLTFILSRMLDRICSRLRSRNGATNQVHLELGMHVRVLNLPIPVRNPRLLTRLLILDLEAHPPGAPIRRVVVEAIPAMLRVVQNGLFVPLSPEPEKLELTLARLSALVGEENVGSPELLDTHRPDAFRMNNFSRGVGQTPVCPRKASVSLNIRLFRPPLDATVQIRDSIPAWIAFHGVHGPIRTASGPWRTSGDWWRPDTWDREEWDIEVSDALYRIYYDVHTDRWFAQGVYD